MSGDGGARRDGGSGDGGDGDDGGGDGGLGRLVEALSSKASYATGARRFPSPVSRAAASDIAEALAGEVDAGTRARAAQAEAQGFVLACRAGCHACCETMVMVYLPEALAVARFLGSDENAAARDAFLRALPAWRAAVGDTPERIAALTASGDATAAAEADTLHRAHYRRRVPCAFLVDGRCAIYAVRPLGCRHAHALGTPDRCAGGGVADGRVEALAFVPLDRLLGQAQQLLRAAHNALADQDPQAPARRHRRDALCATVGNLLAAAAPASSPTPSPSPSPSPTPSPTLAAPSTGR